MNIFLTLFSYFMFCFSMIVIDEYWGECEREEQAILDEFFEDEKLDIAKYKIDHKIKQKP